MPKPATRSRTAGSRRSRTRPSPSEAVRRQAPPEWVERHQLGTGEGQPVESVWFRAEERAKA